MRKKILKRLEHDCINYGVQEMSERTRLPYMTLYRIYKRLNAGHVKWWDLLMKYYRP